MVLRHIAAHLRKEVAEVGKKEEDEGGLGMVDCRQATLLNTSSK